MCVTVRFSVLQCVAVRCNVLQYDAVCCSVLQWIACQGNRFHSLSQPVRQKVPQTDRQRQTDRNTDRQTNRQLDRQTDRQTVIHTHARRKTDTLQFQCLWIVWSNASERESAKVKHTEFFRNIFARSHSHPPKLSLTQTYTRKHTATPLHTHIHTNVFNNTPINWQFRSPHSTHLGRDSSIYDMTHSYLTCVDHTRDVTLLRCDSFKVRLRHRHTLNTRKWYPQQLFRNALVPKP